MSEEPREPSHLPIAGGNFSGRGYYLKIRFHPEIKLDPKRGHEFAASICDYLNFKNIDVASHQWTFMAPLNGVAESLFIIVVGLDYIQLDVRFPTQGLEWIECHFQSILDKFKETFSPAWLFGSSAIVQGTMPIDGDARAFLAENVMKMDPERINPLGRPIHLVGLRFFLPPYKKPSAQGEEVTDWSVNLRAESLMEDPSQLFLVAEAEWPEPKEWNRDAAGEAVGHLGIVKEYLEKNMVLFLRKTE
jgi:hypothetical protein